MNIILFGFKGSGKTFFGERLAEKLKREFIDTDFLIEQRAGTGCREIYQTQGEKHFRFLEKQAVASLRTVTHAVIAVGGGAVLDKENCSILSTLGVMIYVKADKKTLFSRMLQGGIPAFLDPHDVKGSFEKLYRTRKVQYEKISAIELDEREVLEWLAIPLETCLESPHGANRMVKR